MARVLGFRDFFNCVSNYKNEMGFFLNRILSCLILVLAFCKSYTSYLLCVDF